MKWSFIVLYCIIGAFAYKPVNQSQIHTNEKSIRLLAEFISKEKRNAITVAKYRVLKIIEGQLTADIINVGYSSKFEPRDKISLLTIEKQEGNFETQDYYIFPNYNIKEGIENVKISTVEFDYWESCETGKGECQPLKFTRSKKDEKWFMILPCGGTSTTVYLSEEQGIPNKTDVIQKNQITAYECPPVFELTELKDGKYYAYMLSCGLGGQIEIVLSTKDK